MDCWVGWRSAGTCLQLRVETLGEAKSRVEVGARDELPLARLQLPSASCGCDVVARVAIATCRQTRLRRAIHWQLPILVPVLLLPQYWW